MISIRPEKVVNIRDIASRYPVRCPLHSDTVGDHSQLTDSACCILVRCDARVLQQYDKHENMAYLGSVLQSLVMSRTLQRIFTCVS